MKLKEIMTTEVETVQPNDTLQAAAKKMRDRDVGFLPVLEGDQLVGVLTDRDLAVRAVAYGLNSDEVVGRDLMTNPAISCFDDQDVEAAVQLMHTNNVRRLVILNHKNNRIAGVVSLGDLVSNADDNLSGKLLQRVSAPVTSR